MQGDAKEGRSTYRLLHDLDNVFAIRGANEGGVGGGGV